MKKQKDNNFSNKFRLLCSQESKEDIVWSLSDSSDYDNLETEQVHTISSNLQDRKRKRKKKAFNNISNLNITIIDTKTEHQGKIDDKKNNDLYDNDCDGNSSPILNSQYKHKISNMVFTSPIISSNTEKKGNNSIKSPILMLKSASPTYSPKVRKKLFYDTRTEKKNVENIHKCKTLADMNKINEVKNYESNIIRSHSMYSNNSEILLKLNNPDFKEDYKPNLNRYINDYREILSKAKEKQPDNNNILDDSIDLLRPASVNFDLVKKVKSYFDSHFSSESASQHSINDTPTPNNSSKTSDDIDISNTITQMQSNRNSTELIKEDVLENNVKSKKFRYKKDGLAYRLSTILKKHNAHISLWQHERFLAANSNFIIPKGDHLIFHIRNVQCKYGCYLLEAKDVDNDGYLILINNEYVTDSNILKDVVMKLYEPYKILKYNDNFRLVINVCKFECISVGSK